jgi:phage baseplate assembly protein W
MSGTIATGFNPAPCDLALTFGGDLAVSATGDLAVVSGSQLVQQRVLLRLLTNPGSYIWWLNYGAGLARFIGRPAAPLRISALASAQMALESGVTQTPPPQINTQTSKDGVVTLSISYVDAADGTQQVLTLPVGD